MAKQSQGAWWIDKNYPPNIIQQPGVMTVDAQYNIEFDSLLSCAYQVVRFRNLPDTIDETYLKMCIFLAGRCAIFRDTRGDGALRGLDCSTVNKPTIYYMPSQILIVNPTFRGYSYTLTPGKDCAVIYCREVDRYQYGRETGGLYGLIATHAQLLADNTISINVATKNMRLTNVIGAEDSITVKSIDEVIQDMYNGVPYKCVRKSLVDNLTSVPMTQQTNTQQLLQLIQARQYIYAHFYEQLGLKTHDQLKKERLISSEIDEGTELAVFNIQDMIASLQNGVVECNRINGTEIEIELHPLIASTLQDPAAVEPEDQADVQPAADPVDESGDNQADMQQSAATTTDYMAAIYQAAAERVAELIRGRPADDQSDDQTDAQSDGEPDVDQSDGEPDVDQSDGEPDTDQSDDQTDDQSDDQTDDQSDDQISVDISGNVDGDIDITITQGGDDDGD